jgi:chloride channel 2
MVGLIVGRGGPFVHIASILANQLAKLRLFSKIEKNASLKNHMLGVACGIGMAGSHGATVGGVLFSIEVTSTYFSLRNYWYSFVSAFVAGVTYRVGWNSFMGRSTLTGHSASAPKINCLIRPFSYFSTTIPYPLP